LAITLNIAALRNFISLIPVLDMGVFHFI
jgi:hypothetical protein